ncbi:hypothetical protein [Paracidovorax wautersii]|uniref:DGQHR domain-containing protein n=1 Tax=Paracidovorax wautersii TaxID=1177982 RepID=A0A1I2GLV1_9BURK|nr:hypothetical protein [Paracidovorax wautersii]SFF17581.1 hypothetical protein SAMN04489711_11585 [Paracidovorax wautersii]
MPLNIQALTIDRDDRLQSYCVTAKCSYQDFLSITQGAERNLEIQRSVIRGNKAYATLRSDLKKGCVLPPIVLAISHQLNQPIETLFEQQSLAAVGDDLSNLQSANVYVIDGLQRTNAIRQTLQEMEDGERTEFLARPIRIEMWMNIPFGAIAYRMLLLNAGQRPMSVRHQVEVLSSKLIDDLGGIQELDVFRIGDQRRRTQPGQFSLAKLAQAFQAWLQGQPNLDLRNTVMEELLADSAVEVLGKTVPATRGLAHGDGFRRLVEWIVSADVALGAERVGFFGNETVLLGFAAAVGASERNDALAHRVWSSLDGLVFNMRQSGGAAMGVEIFDALRQGIDAGKVNVGVATREMVFSAFREFIRGAGEISMSECWKLGAASL